MESVAIAIEELRVEFGDRAALDSLSLTVQPGELVLLLGPSGCGKSTLLRSIAGFVEPTRGRILLGGRDVTRLPPHQRQVGMVFQSFALFPHLSVGENVAFGLREQKVPRDEITERITQALKSVRLPGFADRRVDHLSGGEQQRVALARALVTRPRCLLLDEPLSNLDAGLRQGMREEIRRVCKEHGLTTMYVTHDQKEAMAIADRIAVMRGGHILQLGTPLEIYRRPCSADVASLLGDTNLVSGTVVRLENDGAIVTSAVGELLASDARGFGEGQRVTLSIRPECLKLGSAAPGADVLQGELKRSIVLGEIAEHRVDVSGRELRCFELNPHVAHTSPGERVSLSVAPGDVVLLPPDEA